MPHLDGRTGELVIRIVYDGAPEAGKTTNVRQLVSLVSLQRRGAAKSPGTRGDRTEFFDWLDFSGGYLDGRRVRCQLVSVPGQSRLLHRRRYLLEAADAIVFVADSRPPAVPEARESLATTVRLAEKLAGSVPLGVILQANKQDLPGALAPPELATALDVSRTTPVVASAASTGTGVMETFVLAVRLATDRVRALLLGEAFSNLPVATESPESLHTAMLEIDMRVSASPEPPREPETPPAALPPPEAPAGAAPPTDAPAPLDLAPRRNLLPAFDPPAPPLAHEVAAGHVWPPVKGRAALAVATSGRLGRPAVVQPWAPPGALESTGDGGWVLHSTDRWLFDAEAEARLRLLGLVRRLAGRPELSPDGRCLVIGRDGARWRLWMASPRLPSLRESALEALERRDLPALGNLLAEGQSQLRAASLPEACPAGAGGLALHEGRIVLLSLDEGPGEPALAARDPIADLAATLAGLAATDPPLRRWLDDHGQLPVEEVPARRLA